MEYTEVESSYIKSIGYDSDNMLLHVNFTSGGKGYYAGVSGEQADELDETRLKGGSVGKWIRANLTENPNHPFTALVAAGKGFLDTSHKVTSANPIKPNTPEGICPSCQTPSQGYVPPIGDTRFNDMIQGMKEAFSIDSDEQVLLKFLSKEGGYIETCQNCSVTYWIPFSKVHIKKDE